MKRRKVGRGKGQKRKDEKSGGVGIIVGQVRWPCCSINTYACGNLLGFESFQPSIGTLVGIFFSRYHRLFKCTFNLGWQLLLYCQELHYVSIGRLIINKLYSSKLLNSLECNQLVFSSWFLFLVILLVNHYC